LPLAVGAFANFPPVFKQLETFLTLLAAFAANKLAIAAGGGKALNPIENSSLAGRLPGAWALALWAFT
jgi:hypothetical protein